MIGIMLEHDFMIKQSICGTFVFAKRDFSGSDQILLNTLHWIYDVDHSLQ